MHSAIRITFLISIFIYQGHLNGSLIESGVLEKNLSIDNDIIRYLTVKYNKLDLNKEYFQVEKSE